MERTLNMFEFLFPPKKTRRLSLVLIQISMCCLIFGISICTTTTADDCEGDDCDCDTSDSRKAAIVELLSRGSDGLICYNYNNFGDSKDEE